MPKRNVKDVAYDRTVILGTAQQLVSSDRQKEHGDASKNFAMVAELWSIYLGVDILPHEVPMMMTLYKIARTTENPTNVDNYVYIAGYSALAGEQAPEVDVKEPRFIRGFRR